MCHSKPGKCIWAMNMAPIMYHPMRRRHARKELTGLPPALVTVGTMDLFRDENIDYAKRLMAAGVPTDLLVFAGMFHGVEMHVPDAVASTRMRMGYLSGLKRAIG